MEEIKKYINEKKLNVDPVFFFNYFSEGNWVDSKGNPVKSWKQKLLTWSKHNKDNTTKNHDFEQRNYSENELNNLYSNDFGGD